MLFSQSNQIRQIGGRIPVLVLTMRNGIDIGRQDFQQVTLVTSPARSRSQTPSSFHAGCRTHRPTPSSPQTLLRDWLAKPSRHRIHARPNGGPGRVARAPLWRWCIAWAREAGLTQISRRPTRRNATETAAWWPRRPVHADPRRRQRRGDGWDDPVPHRLLPATPSLPCMQHRRYRVAWGRFAPVMEQRQVRWG